MASKSRSVVEKFWAPFKDGAPTGEAAEEWKNSFAEDAVWEMPFAPAPVPRVIEGRAAIGHFADWLFAVAPDLHILRISIAETEDPAVVVVEMQMASTLAINGRAYANTYCTIMRVVDDKIALFREYFDPNVVVDAFTLEEIAKGLAEITAAAAAA